MSKEDWSDERLLVRLTQNKSEKVRWGTIVILRKRPTEKLFNKCEEFIKSSDSYKRCLGIDILAQLGPSPRPFLQPTLQLYFDTILRETDSEVIMSLLCAIGHNNDDLNDIQVDIVSSFAEHKDKEVRKAVVFALLGLTNLRAVDTLIRLSSDKISYIRNWSTFGLGRQIEVHSESINKALWRRVSDKHQETRYEAIIGLAKRRDDRVLPIIAQELEKGEFGTLLLTAVLASEKVEFIPLLQQNLDSARADTTINPEWVNELENCINELSERT